MSQAQEAEVVAAYREMYRGMVEQDIDLLDELLDDEYTLEHMTGYVQPKREWLQHIASGRMRYHAERETSTTVTVTGGTAVLVGQSVVDATIWGGRGTWRLQLTTRYERRHGHWLAMDTVATTY
jgi:hypothetical protein